MHDNNIMYDNIIIVQLSIAAPCQTNLTCTQGGQYQDQAGPLVLL